VFSSQLLTGINSYGVGLWRNVVMMNVCCALRVEKLQRKARVGRVTSRCTKRRSSFWRSRGRMWVFYLCCSGCASSSEGKSLIRFLHVGLSAGSGGEQAVGRPVDLHEGPVWTEGTAMALLWLGSGSRINTGFSLIHHDKHFQFRHFKSIKKLIFISWKDYFIPVQQVFLTVF